MKVFRRYYTPVDLIQLAALMQHFEKSTNAHPGNIERITNVKDVTAHPPRQAHGY